MNRYPVTHAMNWSLSRLITFGALFLSAALAAPSRADQILEATIACGWGYQYHYVRPETRQASEHHKWLVELLQYINNGEVNRETRTFEERSEVVTPWKVVEARLSNKRYAQWVGNRVAGLLPVLEKQRGVLRTQADAFYAPATLNEQPEFKRYLSTREALLKSIERRFAVRRTENGVECD